MTEQPKLNKRHVDDNNQVRLNKRRVWSDQLGGYTYDNTTLAKCQHYPLCDEGRREREAHLERLQKETDSGG